MKEKKYLHLGSESIKIHRPQKRKRFNVNLICMQNDVVSVQSQVMTALTSYRRHNSLTAHIARYAERIQARGRPLEPR